MLRVVITYENGVAKMPLSDRPLTIGSAAGNDLVIACTSVSRQHARVTRRDDAIIIEDLGAKNGILLAGRRVARANLSPGIAVQLGRALLRIEEVSSSDESMALVIESRSASEVAPFEATASLSSADAPRAALAWARRAEAAGRDVDEQQRAELLRRAREIGQWDALVFCDVMDRDPAVRELHGAVKVPLPLGSSDPDWVIANVRSGFLAAYPESSESWRRDFLEYVALKMFSHDAVVPDARRSERDHEFPEGMVPGESAVMRALYDHLRAAAASDLPVLLRGENGTGKELLARLAHAWSTSVSGPFRARNCAAIPAELLEAELFGIRKGIATNVDARKGLFVEAEGGTVFLDEIGDMAPALQAKLLRVLQEREVQPVGAATPVKINVRIVASTNRDLEAMIAEGSFRKDLYYRLRGIELTIPPLRERREDVPALVLAFVARASARHQKKIRGVTAKALSLLMAHGWSGNVRELQHTIEAAVVLARRGAALESAHFAHLAPVRPPEGGALQERVKSTERDAIVAALEQAGGNKTEAARRLGITRAGLYLKLKRYGIE